jgi:protein-disulfide isomerase
MHRLPPTVSTGRLVRRLALGMGASAAALALVACQTSGTPATTPQAGAEQPGLPEGVPAYMVKGSPDAKVTMVEWSDYQCPYCSKYASEAGKQIDEEYVKPGKVRIVFRDFPLQSIHPFAEKASEAARCAGELGGSTAYWLMHDRLFATQDDWSAKDDPVSAFKALAVEAKVDAAQFAKCLDSGAQAKAIEDSMTAGSALGLQATPTLMLGDDKTEGAYPFEAFKEKIDVLLGGGTLPTPTVPPTPEYVEVDAPKVEAAIGDAPAQGAADAPITFIEYSDFQCPYCSGFFEASNKTLIDEFVKTGKVRYAFKDFPLAQLHPNAEKAAEAAHCARDQGGDEAFWKMHDALFGQQSTWADLENPADALAKLATDAGLDGGALKACLEAGTHAKTVEDSFNEALNLGISGTPTFVINGWMLPGVLEPAALRDAFGKVERGEPLKTWVEKAAAQATETTAAGTR